MEKKTIILVVIIGFVIFAVFRSVKPESKTDDQLRFLYERSLKSGQFGAGDREKIEGEMKKRGLIGGSSNPGRETSTEPHLTQLAATNLRNTARKAYDEGWKMGKENWGNDERKCHRHAVTTVLLRRLQAEADAPPVSEELISTLNIEAIPFSDLEPDIGKDAIAEYIVWREHPDLANAEIIRSVMNTLKESGSIEELLKKTELKSLEWLPWSKLL